jgi:hypothetical protein
MSKVDTYACNVCQVQKKEANHWLHGHVVGAGIVLIPWSEKWTVGGDLRVVEGTAIKSAKCMAAIENADAHLCGLEHAMQWAAKELGKPAIPQISATTA